MGGSTGGRACHGHMCWCPLTSMLSELGVQLIPILLSIVTTLYIGSGPVYRVISTTYRAHTSEQSVAIPKVSYSLPPLQERQRDTGMCLILGGRRHPESVERAKGHHFNPLDMDREGTPVVTQNFKTLNFSSDLTQVTANYCRNQI